MHSGRRVEAKLLFCGIVAIGLAGCESVEKPASHVVLNERQTIDLLEHPKKWHRQTVTIKLYPFDLGFGRSNGGWSYPVCFEPCDLATADRSSFMVRADEDRFKGYSGSQPVVVRARFDACNVEWLCNHFWAGVFVETK